MFGKVVRDAQAGFREVVRLSNEEGLGWRQIGERLNVPAMAPKACQNCRTKKCP